MNKKFLLIILIFVTACTTGDRVATPAGVTTVQHSGSNGLRPYTEHTLSNGLRVILVRDDSLPSVNYQMVVKTGSLSDPQQKSGMSLMVASLLEKGTQKKSAPQIAEELALLGASFRATVENDFVYISSSGLSNYRDQLLDLFLELLTKPAFSDAEIERVRKQILSALTETVDNPSGFAGLAFNEFLYGNHPYGRSPLGKRKDILNLKKGFLIRHYLQFYRPNNSILAVVGNYSPDILQKLETGLKTWKSRTIKMETAGALPSITKLETRLINKPDLTQAQIRVGQEGVARSDKDYMALRMANIILGQGFTSRLVDEVRDNLGLTYSISSDLDSQLLAGSLEIETFTRNEKVGEALKKILFIVDKFVKEGVRPQEVDAARGFLLGNFARSVETAEKLAFNLLVLRVFGVPDSYLTDFEDKVESTSVTDVNRSIRGHLHPDRMKVLILANQSQVLPQLSGFQPLEIKQPADVQ